MQHRSLVREKPALRLGGPITNEVISVMDRWGKGLPLRREPKQEHSAHRPGRRGLTHACAPNKPVCLFANSVSGNWSVGCLWHIYSFFSISFCSQTEGNRQRKHFGLFSHLTHVHTPVPLFLPDANRLLALLVSGIICFEIHLHSRAVDMVLTSNELNLSNNHDIPLAHLLPKQAQTPPAPCKSATMKYEVEFMGRNQFITINERQDKT